MQRLLPIAGFVAAAVATAGLYRRWVKFGATKNCRRILVASMSTSKVEAASKALGGSCAGVHAKSLVSDQPIGLDETLRGAKNRLAAVVEGAAGGADLVVAIENGILRLCGGKEETWVDVAVVIVHDLKTGAESFATSAGVQVPTHFVGQWAEAGSEGTVGECIADELRCNKQDPHSALTKKQFARAALLEQAIRVAASTLATTEAS
jgi:non-canonical (house-cleaning) NTP pyrophosphatase